MLPQECAISDTRGAPVSARIARTAASSWAEAALHPPSGGCAEAGSACSGHGSENGPKPWKSSPHTSNPAVASASRHDQPSIRCAIDVADGNVPPCT